MRQAQRKIAEEDTSAGTRALQQRVVDDLSELIRQMAKKCGGAGQGPSQSKQSSAATAGKIPSRSPARDSVTRLGQTPAQPPDTEKARQLNRQAWGNLPPRLRQPLLNADFERFLPKYERLIERYFTRLAEEAKKP
jgi:hypothetical protein